MSPCGHYPVVRSNLGSDKFHYLVCRDCGLLLDFRPLEKIGIVTDDWRDMPDITTKPQGRNHEDGS